MIAKALMGLSAAITFLFGALHLYYTFTGTNLLPRDPAVRCGAASHCARRTCSRTGAGAHATTMIGTSAATAS